MGYSKVFIRMGVLLDLDKLYRDEIGNPEDENFVDQEDLWDYLTSRLGEALIDCPYEVELDPYPIGSPLHGKYILIGNLVKTYTRWFFPRDWSEDIPIEETSKLLNLTENEYYPMDRLYGEVYKIPPEEFCAYCCGHINDVYNSRYRQCHRCGCPRRQSADFAYTPNCTLNHVVSNIIHYLELDNLSDPKVVDYGIFAYVDDSLTEVRRDPGDPGLAIDDIDLCES